MLICDDNLICIVCYSCWDQYIGINTCGCLPCLFQQLVTLPATTMSNNINNFDCDYDPSDLILETILPIFH